MGAEPPASGPDRLRLPRSHARCPAPAHASVYPPAPGVGARGVVPKPGLRGPDPRLRDEPPPPRAHRIHQQRLRPSCPAARSRRSAWRRTEWADDDRGDRTGPVTARPSTLSSSLRSGEPRWMLGLLTACHRYPTNLGAWLRSAAVPWVPAAAPPVRGPPRFERILLVEAPTSGWGASLASQAQPMPAPVSRRDTPDAPPDTRSRQGVRCDSDGKWVVVGGACSWVS